MMNDGKLPTSIEDYCSTCNLSNTFPLELAQALDLFIGPTE